MSRKADETRLSEAEQILQARQGERASYYARAMRIHRYDFNTLLAMLNDRGVRLWEDKKGRLWLCDPDQD